MTDRPDLGDAFGFTPEDLAENRAGRITSGQHDRIRKGAVGALLTYGMGGGFAGLVIIGLTLPSLDGQNPFPLALVILGAVIVLLGGTMGYLSFKRANADLTDGRTEPVTGAAYLGSKGRAFRIGTLDLFISAQAKAAFIPGQTYTVYLAQHSRTPLSAEPVG